MLNYYDCLNNSTYDFSVSLPDNNYSTPPCNYYNNLRHQRHIQSYCLNHHNTHQQSSGFGNLIQSFHLIQNPRFLNPKFHWYLSPSFLNPKFHWFLNPRFLIPKCRWFQSPKFLSPSYQRIDRMLWK